MIFYSGDWLVTGQGMEIREWWMYSYGVTVDMKKYGSHESFLHLMKNCNLKLNFTSSNNVCVLKILHLYENVILTGQIYKIVIFLSINNVIIFLSYKSHNLWCLMFRVVLDSSKYAQEAKKI
jgi:hypothetical protein